MARRDELVAAALRLFMREGIRGLPVGRLSQALGVSTKTIYHLFGDKKGLVQACMAQYLSDMDQRYGQLSVEGADAAEVMLRFYRQQVDGLLRIHPGFLREATQYLPDEAQRGAFFAEEATRELLSRGQAEGLFQPGMRVDVATETLILLLETIFEGQRFAGRSTRELMTQVLWPYLRGLCTSQGLEAFRKYREQL